MEWKDNGNSDFEMPEPGTYGATCYRLIDIGTQTGQWQGKEISNRQVVICWELDELMSNGKPFVITNFYTASLSEKANLRKHMVSWRGRDFTEQELQGFDPKAILGAPCMLTLSTNEKGRIKVTGVSKLPKNLTVPPLVNEKIYFSLEHGKFDESLMEKIGEGLRKKIMQSPEYIERHKESSGIDGLRDGGTDEFDDSIPF